MRGLRLRSCHVHRTPVCCSTYSRPVGGTVSVLRKRQRSGCMFSFYICCMRFLKMNTFTSSSVIFIFHHSSFHMANHNPARAGFSDWLITDEIGRHWDSQQSLPKCPDYIFPTKAAAVKHQPGGTSFPDATPRTQLHWLFRLHVMDRWFTQSPFTAGKLPHFTYFQRAHQQMDTWDKAKGFGKPSIWQLQNKSVVVFFLSFLSLSLSLLDKTQYQRLHSLLLSY